jgi:hypothetical protein
MATTIVPAFDGPITTTAEQIRRLAHEMLIEAQGDLDKTTDVDDLSYYTGLVDAYTTVLANLTTPYQVPEATTAVRVVADYQMFGDYHGTEWAHLVLSDAKKREIITDFQFLHTQVSGFVQVVSFTVDFSISVFEDLTHEEVVEHATNLLNEQIVHDSDVSVRAIGGV